MMNAVVTLFVTLIAVADIQSALALPSTVPAFLWSPHYDEFSSRGIKDVVNYQTISPKDLAKSVLSEGGWGNLLCLEKKLQHHMDVALVFVGREAIVLLIILISGLCCMMGIDTPTRFEAPQES